MQALAEEVRHSRVEPEDLLQDGLQVRHRLKVCDGEVGVAALAYHAFHGMDLFPEARLDMWLFGELEERPAERV